MDEEKGYLQLVLCTGGKGSWVETLAVTKQQVGGGRRFPFSGCITSALHPPCQTPKMYGLSLHHLCFAETGVFSCLFSFPLQNN